MLMAYPASHPKCQSSESATSTASVTLSCLHYQPATCLLLRLLLTLVYWLEVLHHRMWDVTSWVLLKGPYDISKKYKQIKFLQSDFCPVRKEAGAGERHISSFFFLFPLDTLESPFGPHLTIIVACVDAKSLQLCPTLCNPMDCSPPGSSVQGVLQARILEWVAMLSSRGSFQPMDRICISYVSCIGRQVLYL